MRPFLTTVTRDRSFAGAPHAVRLSVRRYDILYWSLPLKLTFQVLLLAKACPSQYICQAYCLLMLVCQSIDLAKMRVKL